MKRLSYLTLAALTSILLTLTLSACGDTPAPTTTVPATTAAAVTSTTTAAANASNAAIGGDDALALAGLPLYSGASLVPVGDAFKNQALSGSNGSVKDYKFSAFTTADDRATVKAFYTDYLNKNGWHDFSSTNQAAAVNNTFEQNFNGFYLLNLKDNMVLTLFGFDGTAAAASGVTSVPDKGSLIVAVVGTKA